MITFFPTVYNISIDGERLFLQFLMVTFVLGFIYVMGRSKRIVEKQYTKTSKKISKLRSRVAVVLSQHEPMCRNVLYHNVVRYQRSLVASYLKDLLDEKQLEPEQFSNFFKDLQRISSTERTFSSSTGTSEKFNPILSANSKKAFGKDIFPNGYDDLTPHKGTSQNYCEEKKMKGDQKNELRVVKRPLESKIFKTSEGLHKRVRSSLVEKRKSKTPKWNIMGLNNVHERCNQNITVCTALTETRSPFKVKSNVKSHSHKKNVNLKSSYAKPELLNSNVFFVVNDKQSAKENENQEKRFIKENKGEGANVAEDCSVFSIGSSGCESDCDSEPNVHQSAQAMNKGNVRQNSPLTTINEESAEENCPSD